jgi:hypothetical protein
MAAGIALGSDYSQLRKWRARQGQAEAGPQKRLPLHNHDRDYYFELRGEGSGMPNHYAGDVLRTLAISELSRFATSRIYSQIRPSFGSNLLAVFFQEKQVGRGPGAL